MRHTSNGSGIHSLIVGEFPDNVCIHSPSQLGWRGAIVALAREVRRGDAVLINGADGARRLYINQMVASALRCLPDVTVVIADATWTARARPGERHARWLAQLIEWSGKVSVRAMRGPRTHFCFLARGECKVAAREARIPESQVHFTPFHTTIRSDQFDVEKLRALAAQPEAYVFSGGSVSRDYRLLRDAIGDDIPLKVATAINIGQWPSNADVRYVSREEFFELMARSRAVVLPLATDTTRSVGQQTYLNAMLLGKPVVVTDAPGVRDYITDGENAYVVAPTAAELRKAIEYVLDPANAMAVARVANNGRELAERHSPTAYFASLAAVAKNALAA